MKFISKASNVRIILEPGLQAQPLTGSPAKPTVYVHFQNGVAEVKDEAIIAKMKAHPGFNIDFVADEENKGDPFATQRQEIEPAHTITEIKYGHAEKAQSSPSNMKFPPEIQKAINDLAMAKVKELLPTAVMEALKMVQTAQKEADEVVAKTEESEEQAPKTVRKGRPKKVVSPEPQEITNDDAEMSEEERESSTEESGSVFDFFRNK